MADILVLPPDAPEEMHPEFEYEVPLGDAVYKYRIHYNHRQDRWRFSLWTAAGVAMVLSKKLTVNWPVLERHTGRKPAGGELWFIDMGEKGEPCGWEDLGHRCKLMWVPDDQAVTVEEFTKTIKAV